MKILISGDIGSGKSTLLHQICTSYLLEHPSTIFGFKSEKVLYNQSRTDLGQVYLHPYEGPYFYEKRNCIAELTGNNHYTAHIEVFENYGLHLLEQIPVPADGSHDKLALETKKSLILMDEIGFLESNAPLFSSKILELFHENNDIIAVIKPVKTPLLDQLRALPDVQLYNCSY